METPGIVKGFDVAEHTGLSQWDLYHAQQMEERDLNSIPPCAGVASAGSSPIRSTRRAN